MKRLLLCLFGVASILSAQYAGSASGSSVAAAEINGKVNHQQAAGAPGTSYNCTLGKDLYTNTSNGDLYKCTVTGTPGTWALITGGGGGTPGGSTGQMQVNSSGSFAGQGFALSGGGSAVWQRATECATGTVSLSGGTWTYPGGTVAAAAATSQEIPIITGLNGGVRYSRVLLSEHVIFASSTVTVTKASIGRPGPTDDEMLPQTSMMVSSGDAWFAEDRPQTPILGVSNTYSLVLAIRTTGGNVSALTTGAASYEVCAYAGL
jgi:hypothetical protein